MDHTPNKQSKTDAADSLTLDEFSNVCASQRDVFDADYEGSNMGSQFSQSSYAGPMVKYASNRTTPTGNPCVGRSEQRRHTMTPFGDNFSSYHPAKTVEMSIACTPSQPDSTLDPGYSSTGTSSSAPGQDGTLDQGSQMEYPMSQGASWSDGNNDQCSLYGENELEDLLYRFQNYFENRLETEINQLKESIRNMISEQQSHVRQIVQQVACTRSQSSQNSMEEPEKHQPDSSQPRSDIAARLLDGTLYIPDELLQNFKMNRQAWTTSRYEKRTLLLELLADSCSLSSLLTKPEYR